MTRQITHEVAEALFRAAADVMEWNARMGEYESPCWTKLREATDRVRDLPWYKEDYS